MNPSAFKSLPSFFKTPTSPPQLKRPTIEKVLTREETLGRFLYERRDSTWLYTRCILVLSRHKLSMWRWKVWWFLIKNALMTKTLSALIEKVLTREETLGRFLYERCDSTWLYTRCILVLSRHKISMWRWKVWWFLIKNALITKTLSAQYNTKLPAWASWPFPSYLFFIYECTQYNTKLPAWASWPFPIYLFFIYGCTL